MKKSAKYIIFLNNRYRKDDFDFYLKRLRGRVTVAADGGIRFFIKTNRHPDILIGDFDSSPKMSRRYLSQFEVITHPADKDKTDSQLAVELALERGALDIELCGALSTDEIDHTLGNIFLLDLVNQFRRINVKTVTARIVNPNESIYLIENDKIDLTASPGDFLSIIPVIDNSRVSFSGLVFPPPNHPLRFGDSLSLRNRFAGRRARLNVAGKVIVIINYKK